MAFEEVTAALRNGSVDALREALRSLLAAYRPADDRDLMVGLAPYHDCARRLGADPAALFAEAAEGLPPSTAELVRGFGRRTDVTPAAFAFEVVQEPEGPAYRLDSSWPAKEEIQSMLEQFGDDEA